MSEETVLLSVQQSGAAYTCRETLEPWVVFMFLINGSIGVGFLSMPYSFYKAGMLWASGLFFIAFSLAFLGVLWMIGAMGNYAALYRAALISSEKLATPPPDLAGGESLLLQEAAKEPNYSLSGIHCEINLMMKFFFGDAIAVLNTLAFMAASAGVMWAHTAVFATSLSSTIPLFGSENCNMYVSPDAACMHSYWTYIAVFAIIVGAVSCFDLAHQWIFQVTMAFARFVVMGLIIGDSIGMKAFGQAPPNPATDLYNPNTFPDPAPLVNFPEFYRVLGGALFAMAIHFNIPECVYSLKRKNENLHRTIVGAVVTCAMLYVVLALCVTATFGSWVQPVATLNWVNYSGGRATSPQWASVFSTFIIVMPSMDILSAFPIAAIVLGDNVAILIFGKGVVSNRLRLIACRIACITIPIAGAFFVWELDVTVSWLGLITALHATVIPGLLWLYSHNRIVDRFGESRAQRHMLFGRKSAPFLIGACVAVWACTVGGMMSHVAQQGTTP